MENDGTRHEKSESSIPPHTHPEATESGMWIHLNHKGIYHDNRRLVQHRSKNCECFVCYREMYKLPPAETKDEYIASLKAKMKDREIKRAKRLVKKEMKKGKQASIVGFLKRG